MTDEKTPRYKDNLAGSIFCGVLPGWGWSGRMEDSVLHGCIPVVIQDGVDAPWETSLDWRSYSMRITREQVRAVGGTPCGCEDGASYSHWHVLSRVSADTYACGCCSDASNLRDPARCPARARGGHAGCVAEDLAALLLPLHLCRRARATRRLGES